MRVERAGRARRSFRVAGAGSSSQEKRFLLARVTACPARVTRWRAFHFFLYLSNISYRSLLSIEIEYQIQREYRSLVLEIAFTEEIGEKDMFIGN